MSDTNPCNLISGKALQRLQVAVQPRPKPLVPGVGTEGTSCVYLPTGGDNVNLGVVTNYGIDRWTDGDVKRSTFKDLPRIRGFRTIRAGYTYSGSDPHDTCMLYVDVADDQSLKVEVGANLDTDPPTCDTARRFAEAAMRTLLERQGPS